MTQLNYTPNDIVNNIVLSPEQIQSIDLFGMMSYLDESFEQALSDKSE